MKQHFQNIGLRVALLVVAASFFGLAFNALSPAGTAILQEPPKPDPATLPWKEISIAEGKAFIGRAVFVDARSRDDYLAGHIMGAMSLPVEEYDAQWMNFANAAPTSVDVVVYCGGGSCDLSHQLAKRLSQADYKKLHVLKDGITGWKAEKLPVSTGENP